jgi:prepilin peptidase CpaA
VKEPTKDKGKKMPLNMSSGTWQIGSLSILTVLVGIALVTDLRQRRIPNTLVLITLCMGVLVNTIGPQAFGRSNGLFTLFPDAVGFHGAVLGALTGLAVFLPIYLMQALGAGDVKLMAGIGSFVGPATALNLALFILVMGGVLALVRMALARNSRVVMFNVVAALSQMLPGSMQTFDPAHTAWRMPYALAMVAGLLAYGAWIFTDHAPLIRF